MKIIFKIALLVLIGVVIGCSSKSTKVSIDKTKWKNNIYSRIGEAPVNGGFQMEDYWVWGSSVIKGDDSLYHMFACRWPKFLPFHPGWMVGSDIVHATSKTPEGPYEYNDIALKARGAEYWDGRSVFNPYILKHKDLYVMFYTASTHPFREITKNPDTLTTRSPYCTVARSNERIGIATSKSPYGPWKQRDAPALPTKPGTFYSFLTSNPAPWINEDGSVDLIFKSRTYRDKFPFQTKMKIGLAHAKSINDPFEVVTKDPIFSTENFGVIEDPYLWKDENGYHLIAKDQYGDITGKWHCGVMAHSTDAIHWELDKAPLAYERKIKWSDGKTIEMGQLERPFLLRENGKLTHLFFATMDGPGGFNNSTKSWNMVLPLNELNEKK